jgi:alkylated DNA repair dioxygenase AlkB
MRNQIELFEIGEKIAIPGATYLEAFISLEEERALIAEIESGNWTHEFARRRQHYGVAYGQTDFAHPSPLPPWIRKIAERVVEGGWFSKMPVQARVNEYQPGQGISAHKDYDPFEEVASLSLLSGCLMELACAKKRQLISLWLEPRSLLVLTGEARHDWTHAIRPRLNDLVQGLRVPRRRRLSLTLRTLQVTK